MSDKITSVPSVSVTYARNGGSTKANALGMRPMQERAYEKRGEQYLLIKSPPASGKSRALMFVALDKLKNQGLKQAIIVVPEKSIGASFNDEPLSKYGFWSDWHVEPKWTVAASADETVDIDDLAAELADVAGADDITVLRHVRTSAEKRAAEEIADRKPCEDFETFRPSFERVQTEVKTGMRQSQPIEAGRRAIEVGDFFVLDGLTLYVAEVGEPLKTTAGEVDRRLRLIFSNGTESNLLLRSLQRAFYNDPAARRLASPESGQLSFGGELEADDVESGTIYVLRSLSDHPYVAQHRDIIHKMGVTGGRVETRIANAEHDSTYLLAKVEVVATYKLAGINRTRMENLFHRLFAPARLNITINDRFGHPVQPEEWFLVPLFVIDEAVARIKDGSITGYIYDPSAAKLVKA